MNQHLDPILLNQEFCLVDGKGGILDVGEFPYILQEAIFWLFEEDGYEETYIIPEGAKLDEVVPLTINPCWFSY